MNPALLPRALTAGLAAAVMAISSAGAQTVLDKVSFGTNWVAEAEHGGFFQALADGTYKSYGLDVTIVPGGPNNNNRMLLIAGKLDFFMSANTLQSFDAVANNVPLVTVAAIFQKDPQVFLTHPESKVVKLEDLKPLTLFVSKEGVPSYFQWLKSEYGFSEDKVKPYTFNAAAVHRRQAKRDAGLCHLGAVRGGKKPPDSSRASFLLADYGFNAYSTLIETRRDLDRQEAGPGAALCRCLDDRLVQLSLRRQRGRQRDDQETQSGNDRRIAGLFDRQDEGIWHCRFRRYLARRHRRHDRRTVTPASSTRWCGPVSCAATSISAKPTRCALSTRASA